MVRVSFLTLLVVGALAGAACAGEVAVELKPAEKQPQLEVEIGEFGPVHVAFTEHTGSFEKIGKAISSLFRELGEQGIKPAGPVMGIYQDDPKSVPEEKLRWEVAIEMPEAAVPNEPLKVKTIAKCTVARAEYKGPVEGIGEVYELLVREAFRHDYIPVGPAVELFIGPPKDGVIECTAMYVVEKAPPLEVEFVAFGPETVVYAEHTGSYDQMPKAVEAFLAALKKQGIEPAGPLMGIYLNDPRETPEDKLLWEIAAPVEGEPELAEPLKLKTIKKCTVARAAYKGPVEELSVAYMALFGQMIKRDYILAGPAMELLGKAPKDGVYECTIMFPVRRLHRIHEPERTVGQ